METKEKLIMRDIEGDEFKCGRPSTGDYAFSRDNAFKQSKRRALWSMSIGKLYCERNVHVHFFDELKS